MKPKLLIAALFIAATISTHPAKCQTLVRVQGGNPIIAITTGIPAGEPLPVFNTTTRLRYRRSNVTTKITVGTVCPGQSFNLSVMATNPQGGVAAPEVALIDGMPAADFLTDIPAGRNPPWLRCTLRYAGSSLFSQGNSLDEGDDIHLVTYTIIAQ